MASIALSIVISCTLSALGNALNTSSIVLLKPVALIIATRANNKNFFMMLMYYKLCKNVVSKIKT